MGYCFLEIKMKQNRNKNTLRFLHKQNYGISRENQKYTLKISIVKREAFWWLWQICFASQLYS